MSAFNFRSAFDYGPLATYKSAFSYTQVPIDEDEETTIKESWLSAIFRKVVIFILYIVVLFSFPVSFWICLKKVHALERIVLMRLGKLQPVYGPGFAVVFPFIDKWSRVDLRPRTITLSTPELLTSDGAIVEGKTDIEYQVSDAIRYVMRLQYQVQVLTGLAKVCLTNTLASMEQSDLEVKRDIIASKLKEELNRSSVTWGLEITLVHVYPITLLKEAPPVDVLGNLLGALKSAVTGDQSSSAIRPESGPKVNMSHIDDLKNAISMFVAKFSSEKISAKVKMQVVGATARRTFQIEFENGSSSIYEITDESVPSDLQIVLNDQTVAELAEGRISPLNAYMNQKVIVSGNTELLKNLIGSY